MSKLAKRKRENEENLPKKKGKKGSPLIDDKRGDASPPEEIEDVRELSLLLASTQLEVDELIHRLAKFKAFINPIAFGKDGEVSSNIPLLAEYLQSQISVEGEGRSRSAPDIIKIAEHAVQVNSEKLYASIISTVSLLLKAISGLHELRETGNALCRIILHDDHVQIIGMGMSAAKPKEHLISPCLRLLREIVLFDGGSAARAVYRQRHITFQRLDVFLTMRGAKNDDDHKTRKRLSVRNNSISYLLANLRLQSPAAKCYILGRNKWMRALLTDIADDPPGLVWGVLDTLRRDVAEDTALSLVVKGRLFDDWALHQVATLYGFKNDAPEDGKPGIRDLTNTLLQTILVSSDHSLLLAMGSQQDGKKLEQDGSDSEDEAAVHGSRDLRRIKQNLDSLIKHLRPHASIPQADLLLSCFQISPSLLQEYFSKTGSFSFDPKLTVTWIGYSQFLLGIVQQPLPDGLLRQYSDGKCQSVDLLLDHILPPPLTPKVVTKCFAQSSTLIKFFTSRILVAAFDKVIAARRTLKTFQLPDNEFRTSSEVEASSRLLEVFAQRLPRFNDLASQFKKCPDEAVMLRESLSRLLVHYYQETPQLALAENLDISTALSNSLTALSEANATGQQDKIPSMILDHLVQIASQSPSMHWWHKSNATPLSPFSILLQAQNGNTQVNSGANKILQSLMEQNYLTWPTLPTSGFRAFMYSIPNESTLNTNGLYAFLDNSILRCVKKTVVYADLLDKLVKLVEVEGNFVQEGSHPDLLMVTLMEQLPYLVNKEDTETSLTVAGFLRLYIDFSELRGVNQPLLESIRDTMQVCFEKHEECHQLIGKALEKPLEEHESEHFLSKTIEQSDPVATPMISAASQAQAEVNSPPGPPTEDQDHHGLTRWTREDIQDAIADGAIAELILCLCSEHEDIRKQASTGIAKLMRKLEFSGYIEWQQVHLLIGELKETANSIEGDERLPYVAGVFATHILQILTDPLHFLYKKVNTFLNKGPQWTVEKLPSYWVDKILMRPPTKDDYYYEEVRWLLGTLTDALRTPKDMEIYRQSHILEKILTLAASPFLPAKCYEAIVDLLFRCTAVEGSTTLITRYGFMSWLTINVAKNEGRLRSKLILLGRRAYERSDQRYVDEWSGDSLSAAVARLDDLKISTID